MYLIGIDIGGTFTDVMLTDSGTDIALRHKVPTTPEDPSIGAIAAVGAVCEKNAVDPAAIGHVFHGTTIATNALLEYKGATTGMITNEGFRDILHIARHQRPENYSIMQDIPWQDRPLVKRRHRMIVRERRIPPHGEILEPLDEDGVRRAARTLKQAGVDAIAVCFLFSYIDPMHEERAKEIIHEEHPDAFVTTSASVARQFREFERFTTAAMNAFIGPTVRRYVAGFARGLKGCGVNAELRIMGSHGGVATAATVAERPIMTMMSGPAAGVLGGAWAAAFESGRDRVITFDVGGTSADIGIVIDGQITEATARDTWVGGYPVLAPMIDINSIGAGGGSIAFVDGGGAFRVGPRSAGSQPGPAAYGRGGEEPTVTDANLVLGRLDPDNFLGGDMTLDLAAAEDAIGKLTDRLGLAEEAVAEGILTIINNSMANAIRARTVQKGLDPRGFSLVAFGGAGPLHGAEVAAMLDIPEVVVPPYPGLTSAAGLLTTALKYDEIKTQFQVRGAVDVDRLNADFASLEDSLAEQYGADGVTPDKVQLMRSGDLRYVGQGYELRVAFPAGSLTESALEQIWSSFSAQHKAEYGHAFPDSPIEIVNIRVTGRGEIPTMNRPSVGRGGSLSEARVRSGPCLFRTEKGLGEHDTIFYRRDGLGSHMVVAGPAVILQHDTTTVGPPSWNASVTASGNMILKREFIP